MTNQEINTVWRNTHFYDDNMSKDIIENIRVFVNKSTNISKDDKLESFDKFRKILVELNNNPIVIIFYDKIINSYIQSDGKNYDPINNLDAIDLLYVIYLISQNNDDILLLLCDQLEDMKTGFCPQGKTIRLVQIITIFLI